MSSASGVVGPLAPSITRRALMPAGVRWRDLAFQRGRDQDVAIHVPRSSSSAMHLCACEAGHACRVLATCASSVRHVQARFTVDGSAVVLHRHDAGRRLGEQLAGDAAHVAKTLHGHARAF